MKEKEKALTHKNNDIDKAFKSQTKVDNYEFPQPRKLDEKITPIVDVSPRPIINITKIAGGDSPSTMYTIPSDREFYLTNISMNGTNTGATGSISMSWTEDSGSTSSIVLNVGGGVAEYTSNSQDVSFPLPGLKLKSGTQINYTSDISSSGCFLAGYLVDPTISSMHFD